MNVSTLFIVNTLQTILLFHTLYFYITGIIVGVALGAVFLTCISGISVILLTIVIHVRRRLSKDYINSYSKYLLVKC